MKLDREPPAGWDARIAFPLQSSGFAEASRALGFRPCFAESDDGIALVLCRGLPIPVLAGWSGRARVYAHARHPRFLRSLSERLRETGISHIKVGDSLWGMSGPVPQGWAALRPRRYDLFVHPLSAGEETLLAGTDRMIRRHLRKLAAEVTVSEVRTAADFSDYLRLAEETRLRMRGRDVAAVFPPAYFEAIARTMVPRGQAVLFLARAGAAALAAATFVVGTERFAQIHGCSTRDRALTPKQGPTFIFWHAMRYARARGCRTFDMGAMTPTDDPTHPHRSVYEYKKLWGGTRAVMTAGEVVLSPWKRSFQERILAPMWDRLHPLYLRTFPHEAPKAAGTAVAMLPWQDQP